MKKIVFILLLLVGIGNIYASSGRINVIPQPQSCVEGKGSFTIKDGANVYTNLHGVEKAELEKMLGLSPFHFKPIAKKNKATVTFNIVSSITDKEAYTLTVNKKGVNVSAATPAGLFYGFQTLLQLADNDSFTLPYVEISDAPRFAYRGLHLDVSRHFRSKEFIMNQLDAMARYKLNRFHWHLTDGAGWRLEIKKYPILTEEAAYRPYPNWKAWSKGDHKYCRSTDPGAEGGYYTQQDAREIVEYARKLHITVIPEIEMPGHSEEVLAVMPELSCTGKPYVHSDFCIGKEATFTFLQNVLDEVMAIFPSEYIHVGGDEASMGSWKKCPDCQARMKAENMTEIAQLQSYLITRIEKYLVAHGRKLIGWDEILEGGISPTATVMSWRGEEGGIKAAKSHHDVVMTPGGYCYFDFYQDAPATQPEAIGGYLPLAKVYSYNPIPKELTAEESKYILGVQANVWSEYIDSAEKMEYMLYPRVFALAEVAWSQPAKKNFADFRGLALNEIKYLRSKDYNTFNLATEVGERPEAATLVSNLAIGKKITYNTEYSKQYKAAGDVSLIDGVRGGWTYGDSRWLGFLNNNLDVVIDLGSSTAIHSIAAEFMQIIGPWVWLPKEVVISISEDGVNFTEIQKISTEVPTTEEKLIFKNYAWSGTAKARYISYKAINNGIDGGWIFTDEIIVK